MCTSLQLKAKDGSVVVGRTMEFPTLMDARLVVLPRGLELHSYAPDNKQGVTWTTKYGAVGIDAFPNIEPTGYYAWTDGMNEKGLYVALQYHPGTAVFSSPDGVADDTLMSAIHLSTLVLSTCANFAEVRAKLAEVVVWPYVLGPMGMAPPCHFVFHDASGGCIAVEWDAGEMKIYDNPFGVFTNSPEFTWHTTNLRNYTHLSPDNPAVLTVAGQKLAPFGVGQGMQGLPGDNSSPSRFVRAATYVATAPEQADAAAAQRIVEGADRPNGGYCVDIWHHVRGANDLEMVKRLGGERVFAIQMNDGALVQATAADNPRGDYKTDCLVARVPPGLGEFDCAGFIRVLHEMGVAAPISLEVCSKDLWEAPPTIAAQLAADGMRKVLRAAGVAGSAT